MKHAESELIEIKNSISEMWKLVINQFIKSKQALLTNNHDLARVVISTEKRVNAFELKIDRDCENYIALYAPVAVDLRLVLSLLKINKTLERIGDFAAGISRYVLIFEENERHLELLKTMQIDAMMSYVEVMLEKSLESITNENTTLAGFVFSTDNKVDTLYRGAMQEIAKFVKANIDDVQFALYLVIILRKIERSGDHCNNIMEEIVFYIDAKVLKHQKQKK